MPRRTTKQRNPTTLKADMDRLAASKQLAAGMALGRLQNVWAEALGPAIAEAAAPVAFDHGKVRIAAKNSAWANELQLMAVMLVQKLNEALPRDRVTGISVYVTKFKRAPKAGED